MNCEYELNFFCDILKKCHISVTVISLNDSVNTVFDSPLADILGLNPDDTMNRILGSIEDNTKYNFSTDINLKYVYMRVPVSSQKNILFIGPYLSSALSSKDIAEIGELAGLSLGAQKIFKEYCLSVPILPENDRIFTVINTLCERIWQTPSFAITEVNKNHLSHGLSIENASRGESFDEISAAIKTMELRYAFENELIRAVSLGQQHKEELLSVAFDEQVFEKRIQDTVRNSKNYCIIMNTLLRKAAENGGVHPIYIDRVSSKFAIKIEQMTDEKAFPNLMREMFSSYCRLVRKHSMKKYSPIVKKTILIIDSDISAELSLNGLSQKQGISAGYLATVFKKETGKTISEYIKDKRIDHAIYLLDTTHLQIQTVALHCGIMDVQYFSKIFKKKTGKTPREYRESLHRQY